MKISIAMCAMAALAATASAAPDKDKGKIPITTSSEEARQLFIKGRDLSERLRATDAHALFQQAIAKDGSFAIAYLNAATSSGSTAEFFAGLARAVALVDKASPGEALLIKATDAGAKGDVAHQKEYLEKLAKQYPNDERALQPLANYYFGRQDYTASIGVFEKVVKINPAFSQPYNQLGYAYRFTGKPQQAEKAFQKYIELIPDDPNPYDSYAELLMELGRFDESIKSYEKALALDKNFIASYVGIGNNQMFLGRGDDARKTFGKLAAISRNDGEKRQAIFWTSVAYLHESQWDKALAEVDKLMAISNAGKDLATVAADHNFAGQILIEAGRLDAAAARFKQQLETIEKAEVPAEVKETARRNAPVSEIRIALLKNDLATAKTKVAAFGTAVAAKKLPFEVRQHHELVGLVAIAEKKFAVAAAELAKANQRDPRVLYWQAVALQGAGNAKAAKAMAAKAADFNALGANYAYVRAKAKALLVAAK
jgi:tetratricopeptide (TPR) repeat protein